LLEAIEDFLAYLKLGKNYAGNTISAYRRDLLKLAEFVRSNSSTNPQITSLNRILLRNYLRHLLAENLSKKTYNRHLSSIKSFSKYLLKHNLVKSDCSLNLHSLTLDKSLPSYVQQEDMSSILAALLDQDFLHCREKIIIEIFYDTGIRLSEIVALKLKHFNFYNRMLSVAGKGNKQRIIPFSLHLPSSFEVYLDWRSKVMQDKGTCHDYLLINSQGEHLSGRHVQRIVKSVLEKVSTLTKTSPHVIRHSFATHLINSGADISSVRTLLGHESISTTQIYTHLTQERIKSIYAKSHPKGGE